MEDRMRQLISQHPPTPRPARWDLNYRPHWRLATPDHLDRLLGR